MRGYVAMLMTAAAMMPAGCRAKHEAAETARTEVERVAETGERWNGRVVSVFSERGEIVIEKPVIEVSDAAGMVARISGECLTGVSDRKSGNEVAVAAERDSCADVKVAARTDSETLTESSPPALWRYLTAAVAVMALGWWMRKKNV